MLITMLIKPARFQNVSNCSTGHLKLMSLKHKGSKFRIDLWFETCALNNEYTKEIQLKIEREKKLNKR